nr:hypothetical protein [Tanacetum cinerariifolium]
MDTTKAQHIALDDALVAPANHLKIGKCNHQLSSDLKSNEPTIQVVLDALKLTPFCNAFQITANFNGRSHTLNVENFIDMLHICPRLPGQRFEDPPLKEEILSFIRDLGHTREIKGMYHKQNVGYVYLLWEDLVYQVENNNSNKNNDICYLRFTKVIIDYFMFKDQSISRDYKMFWHNARDDPMSNTIRVISRHHDTQVYDAILPVELTNQEMLDFKAYKEYYAIASGSEPPKAKTKYKKKTNEFNTSFKSKTASASKGTRLKSKVKVTKPDMKKQPAKKIKAKGLAVLSKVALSKAEQIKLATKRSKKDFHISHASGLDQTEYKEEDVDEGVHTPSDNEFTDEETTDDKEDDEVFKELYEDVNVNLEQGDAEMTDVNQRGSEQHNVSQESGFKQKEEDTHETLTPISNAQ